MDSNTFSTRIFIASHFGLGDNILCNGIYRYFAKKYELCVLPVRKSNLVAVQRMLSDVSNIIITPYNDFFADDIILFHKKLLKYLGFDVLNLGHSDNDFKLNMKRESIRFDEAFYKQAGIDFGLRWEDSCYPRIMEEEIELFDELGCKKGEYQFLHEDPQRNFLVNRKYLNPNLKVITPKKLLKNSNFFNYGYVLENAAEIHCIESSFAALIESLDIRVPKYAHRYARPEAANDFHHEFTYKSSWNIYE